MTTLTIDFLEDDPISTRRLDEDVISLSSTSLESPIMTPSSSPDPPSDSAQPSVTAEMFTTLLDRNEDVSRREGILSEREKFLQHQVAAITKREDDLDKREQELRFQKLPPLEKLQVALEQLKITDLMKATQLYNAWQLKHLDQVLHLGDEVPKSNPVKKQPSDTEDLVESTIDDPNVPCTNCRQEGHTSLDYPLKFQQMLPARSTTSDSASTVAKRTEPDTAQSKLPAPKVGDEDLGRPHDTRLSENVGPRYAKGLVDRLEKFEDKLQQLLLQATGEEKNVSHQSKSIAVPVAPPKPTCYSAPKPSADGHMPDKPSFASSDLTSPSSPAFLDPLRPWFSSTRVKGPYRVNNIVPKTDTTSERKSSTLNGINWPPVNDGESEHVEYASTPNAIKASTTEPQKQPEPTGLNKRVSSKKSKREPSWFDSFANTSASTSKTATVPPPPKRNWPISTTGPDLKAPASFSNTFKVPEVNDEDSEDERKEEHKDQRVPRFFRPNSPQVRSKDDEPNMSLRNRLDARRRAVEDHLNDVERREHQQINELKAKDMNRQKPGFTAEEIRSLMYRD